MNCGAKDLGSVEAVPLAAQGGGGSGDSGDTAESGKGGSGAPSDGESGGPAGGKDSNAASPADGGEGSGKGRRRKPPPADYSRLCSHSIIDLHLQQQQLISKGREGSSGGGVGGNGDVSIGGGEGNGDNSVPGMVIKDALPNSVGRSSCYECLVGSSSTHGLPGGAVCCGTRGDLGRCPRAWA